MIKRVPYSQDAKVSGATVKVTLPDGRELTETVVVEDVLVVALGDSFMSGESNPDRPVTFSAAREMVYDPVNAQERLASRNFKSPPRAAPAPSGSRRPTATSIAKSLPRRKLEDEENGLIYRPNSTEFQQAFDKRGAQWLSADCHRSQYGYPFRVGLAMTLENRHRAVTLVSVACSGADVTGLFMDHDARERAGEPGGAKVPPQLDQLADLICRGGAKGRSESASYTLPVYKSGSTAISQQTVTKQWCPAANRKRPIDLVLLSIGGNDIGFGAVALYAVTESARDLAPIASLVGSEIRFGPDVSRAYLAVLDRRIKAVRDALTGGFGVDPARVLQNAYEPIQFDETGSLLRRAADARHGRASLAQGEQGAAERGRRCRERAAEAARMHFLDPQPARLPGRACDRGRHRLPLHHRPRGGLLQARHLRARPDPRADRSGRDEDAAPLQGERGFRALFAGRRAALRPSLAADPQSERRVPDRQHAP